jgi:hypothetical protein
VRGAKACLWRLPWHHFARPPHAYHHPRACTHCASSCRRVANVPTACAVPAALCRLAPRFYRRYSPALRCGVLLYGYTMPILTSNKLMHIITPEPSQVPARLLPPPVSKAHVCVHKGRGSAATVSCTLTYPDTHSTTPSYPTHLPFRCRLPTSTGWWIHSASGCRRASLSWAGRWWAAARRCTSQCPCS